MLTFSPFFTKLISCLPLVVGALPLLAALVVGLGGRWRLFRGVSTILLASAMGLSGYLLVLTDYGFTWQQSFTWLPIPGSAEPFRLGIRVNFPVAVMMGLTTTVSFWVHLYAMAYLVAARRRYVVLTGGFISTMLGFWMADNLLGRFIGWELLGWGSYGLIGFWYTQEAAARSSTKAWLINQLGSVSLLIGILLVGSELGTLDLAELAALPPSSFENHAWLGVARFCLVAGLCVKSAQWPWFNWLSSAMTAPTPASALIHTATMVGAGVYLLVGLSPILGMATLNGVACVGAITSLMGAYAALIQPHAKQVLAYSTISQLGYAVMAVGVGASSVGLFHFVTHAFCKACLFLCVGVVSRFVGTGSMQTMGGLRRQFPVVFGAYLLAAFSLLGVPGLAGALSKEAVLACTWAWAREQALAGHYTGYAVPGLAWMASLLAVVYLGRQGYLIFMGKPRWTAKPLPQSTLRSAWVMQGSMVVLALGTLGGWYGPLLGGVQDKWLLPRLGTMALPPTTSLQHGVLLASCIAMVLGLGLCVGWQSQAFRPWPAAWTQLSLRGWYLDALTDAIAKQVLGLSHLVARLEQQIVVGLVQGMARGYVTLGYVTNWVERQLISGLVQGISVGYVVLGHVVSWLDTQLLGKLVLLIAAVPRYLGKAHQITQKGNWQQALWWIFLGIGLLCCGIYWAMQGGG